MSHDVIWGQFVPFPPHLCAPNSHPHPRLVLRPQTASPPPYDSLYGPITPLAFQTPGV